MSLRCDHRPLGVFFAEGVPRFLKESQTALWLAVHPGDPDNLRRVLAQPRLSPPSTYQILRGYPRGR